MVSTICHFFLWCWLGSSGIKALSVVFDCLLSCKFRDLLNIQCKLLELTCKTSKTSSGIEFSDKQIGLVCLYSLLYIIFGQQNYFTE